MSAEAIDIPTRGALNPTAAWMLWLLVSIAVLPWAMLLIPGIPWSSQLVLLVAAFATGHVGTTGLFWADRRYRQHINTKPLYFYGLPLALIGGGVALAALFGLTAYRVAYAVMAVWQPYHFAKQNWGILCLSASATAAPRPRQLIRHLYVIGCLGGALGFVVPVDAVGALHWIRIAGGVTVALGASVALVEALRQAPAQHPVHTVLGIAGALFFAPLFLFDPIAGFGVLGVTHGLQYAVLMSAVAADRKQGSVAWRLTGVVLLWAALVVLSRILYQKDLWCAFAPAAATGYLCLVFWHFHADADLWRLSDPVQRRAIKESLPYLFR